MAQIKKCDNCICSCWMVAGCDILNNSQLPKESLIKINNINDTNAEVGELIGEKCAEELCNEIRKAVEASNASTTGQKPLDFLPSKWKTLITNRYFVRWYAKRVSYHWFDGSSITQLKAVGLVEAKNEDEEYKNGFQHAAEKQRKRLAEVEATGASNERLKFLKFFWHCTTISFDCDPDCGKCNEPKPETGGSIGMCILN